MDIILSHENADFDAVGSMLAAHKLYPQAIPVLPERLNRNVAGFLALFASVLPFVEREDLPDERLNNVILTDTHQLPPFKGITKRVKVTIIDHHPLKKPLSPKVHYEGEIIGAASTLLAERLQATQMRLSSLEATLITLGIYEDTGSFQFSNTTPRDLQAAAYLLEQGADLDIISRFLDLPLNPAQQALYEHFVRSLKTRDVEGYSVMVGATHIDERIGELSAVAHKLMDTFDPTVLFLLIQSPEMLNLIGRASEDAVNVSDIAKALGGGGHPRAAAAVLREIELSEAEARVWQLVTEQIQESHHILRVQDLMSYGAKVFEEKTPLREIMSLISRLGHEGYPVVESGQVVGVLQARDAYRAGQHALADMTVGDVMVSGDLTLHPDDTIAELEQKMVITGLGQIPVVNNAGKLLGIVTRTDLLRHWAHLHPSEDKGSNISLKQFKKVLGVPTTELIQRIAEFADGQGIGIYLVGGVVRDVLLKRANDDLDFVVEGDAVEFGERMVESLGGQLHAHRAFGTAKLILEGSTFSLGENVPGDFPSHVDFVSARNEYYQDPAALPTVIRSSVKLDLRRRDFTINTLAVRLAPTSRLGEILDYFGGLHDLDARLIRVLHSLSFVDDPTRILRAVRFEHRLGFVIEERTANLVKTALPLMSRLTGERITGELDLQLGEDQPERAMLALSQRGILHAIHDTLAFTPETAEKFQFARKNQPASSELYWHIWLGKLSIQNLPIITKRLALGATMTRSLAAVGEILAHANALSQPELTPSEAVDLLENKPEIALQAAAVWVSGSVAEKRIQKYLDTWRYIKIAVTGDTLRGRGLTPGPVYTRMLKRLRTARLNGDIQSDSEEFALLDRLVAEELDSKR